MAAAGWARGGEPGACSFEAIADHAGFAGSTNFSLKLNL